MIKLNKLKKYYDESYEDEFPIMELFIDNYNFIPSIKKNNLNYNDEILNYFFENNFKIYCSNSFVKHKNKTNNILLVSNIKKIWIQYSVFNGNITLQCYYDYETVDIDDFYKKIEKFIKINNKSNINLVKSTNYGLDIEEFDLKVNDFDLLLNYGEQFNNVHNLIINRLNKPQDKGIVLLHGDPGTGKTTYIKYLTKLVKDKEILFIPPSMAESLSDPSIIPFLMEHRNSILIIEDAEKVISDRNNNGSSVGVSNILNITDGILGDCLNIQIIATFNMKKEKIDSALLRPGRLIAEHKFVKLNKDESQKLLDNLGKDYVATDSMSLADIYNVDVEIHKTIKEKEKIGF